MRAPIQEHVSISDLLESRENIAPLFPLEILATPPVRFDLSRHNTGSRSLTPAALEVHIADTLQRTGFLWGYGGWAEERPTYWARSLDGYGAHVVHLGIDIWLPAGTPLFAPMTGTLHSYADNSAYLDYGPTIITEHAIGDTTFYLLYGHVSRASLKTLRPKQKLRYGDPIGTVGQREENGSITPHVHLQLIADIGRKQGNFPGVAKASERERYLALCPDPEVLLAPFLIQ